MNRLSTRVWGYQIRDFENADAEHPPQARGVLFVGSSSIRLWDLEKSFPGRGFLNRGFGGSQVSDAVHFADRIIFPYDPRLIVLYSGENDLAIGKSSPRVLRDFQQLLSLIRTRLPDASVILLSVKLSPVRACLEGAVRELNHGLKNACDLDSHLRFVDIQAAMMERTHPPMRDLFEDDGLHLNEQGYQLWTAVLGPLLNFSSEDKVGTTVHEPESG